MLAILKKEINDFLDSLIGYVVIALFLTGAGLLLWVFPETNIIDYGYASMDSFFAFAPYVFMFLIPAVTMKSFAEEKRSGTVELLYTLPFRNSEIVFGKFLACSLLVACAVAPTIVYYFSIYFLGNPVGNLDTAGIIGSYIGLLLLSGIFTAIGLQVSAFCENQIVSFILAAFLCFFFYSSTDSLARINIWTDASYYIRQIGIQPHYEVMAKGLITLGDLTYFFSMILLFLFGTWLKITEATKWKYSREEIFYQLLIAFLSVLFLNQLSSHLNTQADLTEEKRFTIAEPTRDLLRQLDQEVFFEVYLAGELPANFERFRKSIAEILDRFRAESSNRIQYQFIDPGQAGSSKSRNEFYQSLMQQGLQPTNLNYKNVKGDQMQKLVFPGAIASLGTKELPVNLLMGNRASGYEEMLNQSIEGLEYQIASTISQLVVGTTKRIGYVKDYGSPDSLDVAGLKNTLLSKYDLFNVSLSNKEELVGYDAIVVAKPTDRFSERDKYLIDQYIMKGGSVAFFLDALSVRMDSVDGDGTVAIPYETNLADLLFKYGVRLNQNFIVDVNSGQFPVVAGNMGNQPQIQMIPWPFFPVVTNFSEHPSVRNLDAVLTRFVSEVDTVKAVGIKKTPLLFTSPYTKRLSPPVVVAFNDLRDKLRPEKFTDGEIVLAYMLEGEFSSLYANRIIPKGFSKTDFIKRGVASKVVVVGDGDMVRNDLDPETGEPLAIGVEPYTKSRYANEEFVLNLIDYLVDDTGLIETRTRDIKIRPLDKVKLQEGKAKWQIINIVIPLLILGFLAFVKWYFRTKNYAGK
ncbi:MAG: gliding motility-associated ABC transporter substrate-binding protein GldG [Bacteroidota bacterium]